MIAGARLLRIAINGLVLLAVGVVAWPVLNWALIHGVFAPDLAACQASEGACWGVVAQKWQVILFGRYPEDQLWRPIGFVGVWSVLLWASVYGLLQGRRLWFAVAVCVPVGVLLLRGGLPGLPVVPTSLWGGLPLTLLITVLGMGLALPLGVLLALGRQYGAPWVRWVCAAYIDALRALPLVAVLFLAAFVLPLWLPAGGGDLLVRVVGTIALFAAAYLAEVVRGGLQAVRVGQAMAARALGLSKVQVQIWVVLPQALRACLPSLVNSFVTLFKECSLVSIVSLFELTGALGLALAGDVQWRTYYLEGYVFIGCVYWVYCYGLSRRLAALGSAAHSS